MDGAVQHRAQLGPGAAADRLDALPAVAEHDRPLALPPHIDHLVDAHAAVAALLPGLGLDRRRIGQFVVQLQENLLAGDLGGKPALGRVGQLVRRKQPRPRRRHRRQMPLQILDPVPVEARDHEHPLELPQPGQGVGKTEQRVAAHQVDLVEREDRAAPARPEPVDDAPRVGIGRARGVDQQHGLVGIGRAGPGRGDHRAVEPAARLENAGRVDEDQLRLPDGDAEEAGAGGLHLGRDDRQLLADELVEQRRFSGVGRADQRDIAAARRRWRGGGSFFCRAGHASMPFHETSQQRGSGLRLGSAL